METHVHENRGTNGHQENDVSPAAGANTAATLSRLREAFASGRTRTFEWRRQQLEGLGRLLADHEKAILDALHADVGKPSLEAYIAEVGYTAREVASALKNLSRWMKPERVAMPLVSQPGVSRIHREPLGVVLIIGPWNYPFQLVGGPLIGALTAGNCVLVKPSEVAPAVSALLARLLPRYLDPECVAVLEGGVAETTEILTHPFDHIFYTGNGAVGRVVMTAAAQHLTPVTLELGGKSPCIVDRDVDLEVAAKRIAWGKFFNAGQTCVAPDYVLVHEAQHDALLARLTSTLRTFYGDDPQASPDFGRIVNARHLRRLNALIPDSGAVVVGGQSDESTRYFAPTVLRDVPADSPVMADEIFGPILPVLKVKSIEEAVRFINARPKPLALYLYSTNDDSQRRVLEGTSSGGLVINHCWLHLGVPGLPFGGVGASGMGAYHGKHSFETFSHRKAVMKKPTSIDPPIMYPPYTESKETWIRRLL